MSKRIPGSVYVGKRLGSYETELWFYYVLLSHAKYEGVDNWTTAMFLRGSYGAQVAKFTDDEIDQLGYVGHISSILTESIAKYDTKK